MRIIRNPELKGILVILLVALVLGVLLAGVSGKLEQWGLPWFTGGKMVDKIVFVSDRSGTREIYTMDLDGSDQQQLTRESRVLSAPAISSAGNRVVYVGMVGSISQIMAVGAGGGTPYALTSSTGSKRQPGYSPDGKKLSYIESGRIWAAELNGSNPDPVLPTHEEMGAAMGDPTGRGSIPVYSAYAWGPNSESFAGVSSQDRLTDAMSYLPELEGKATQLIPPAPGTKVTGLAFATETPLLAVSIEIGRQQALLAFDPEQKERRPLVVIRDGKIGKPAVSPDGSFVVVPVTTPAGAAAMVKIDMQSGKAGMLVKGQFEDPVVSSDGGTVLAAQHDAKTKLRSIVTIDPESGELTQLTSDGDCFSAVFSPMSQK